MTMTLLKENTDLQVLLYSGLYDYIDDILVSEDDETYILTFNNDRELICEAIEYHQTAKKNYSSDTLMLVMLNTSDRISYKIGKLLDATAQERRYDDMKSVRSYAGFENAFQEEAISLATWGTSCWVKAGEIEEDVLAGNRQMPSVEEVLSEMPVYGE